MPDWDRSSQISEALRAIDGVERVSCPSRWRGRCAFVDVSGGEIPDPALVKRVIAVGAAVEITGGVVKVGGAAIPDPWWPGATRPDGEWEVGPDEVFVLGDERSESRGDSRQRGAVSIEDLLGVVTWRYWPIARAGRLSGGPTPPAEDGAGRPAR